MPRVSSRTQSIPLSGIREMMDLATSIPDVLRLEIGDPNFQTPANISDASAAWVKKNRVSYPPNSGIPELRKAIAKKVTERNGIPCTIDNINVTIGATGALYLALLATLEAGDEVLVPDPGWAGYPAMVGLAGGTMRPYGLKAQNGFKLTVEDVAAAVTDKTRAMILNTPSNPTGAVFDKRSCRSSSPSPPSATCGSSRTSATTRFSSAAPITASARASRSSSRASSTVSRSPRPTP